MGCPAATAAGQPIMGNSTTAEQSSMGSTAATTAPVTAAAAAATTPSAAAAKKSTAKRSILNQLQLYQSGRVPCWIRVGSDAAVLQHDLPVQPAATTAAASPQPEVHLPPEPDRPAGLCLQSDDAAAAPADATDALRG